MSTKIPETSTNIIPRIIRIRDAPFYLGMDKNRFNKEVRPSLTEIKIGTQGIAFDRNELDAWVDDLISRIGKPGTKKLEKISCQKEHRVSPKGVNFGTSTKSSKERDFTKALEQVTSKKQNAT
jgi:predicted DNA-binding transcriptional regulator AlpA